MRALVALGGYAPLGTSGTGTASGVGVDFYGNRSLVPPTSYATDYGIDHGLVAGGGMQFGGAT